MGVFRARGLRENRVQGTGYRVRVGERERLERRRALRASHVLNCRVGTRSVSAGRDIFVGVELGDYGSVFLGDDAAAEFHAGGELAGVDGPLLGDEAKALDGFEIGEGRVDFVDDGLVFSANFWIFDKGGTAGG